MIQRWRRANSLKKRRATREWHVALEAPQYHTVRGLEGESPRQHRRSIRIMPRRSVPRITLTSLRTNDIASTSKVRRGTLWCEADGSTRCVRSRAQCMCFIVFYMG